jgi:hypothetical protein
VSTYTSGPLLRIQGFYFLLQQAIFDQNVIKFRVGTIKFKIISLFIKNKKELEWRSEG